jgi:hypothetical protein
MKIEKILEWLATAIVIAGAVFAALNIYPWSAILLNLGSFVWLIVAIMWRKTSLIVINVTLLVIYTVGLFIELS